MRNCPGRSPHQALDALSAGIYRKRVNWILDADIRGFFDQMSHEWTMQFVQHRVADPRILRLIQKWLKAGVSEDGEWKDTTIGTPQGSVVSPLLANIYLYYVFDPWVEAWRKKVAEGDLRWPVLPRPAETLLQFEAPRGGQLYSECLPAYGRYAQYLNARRQRGPGSGDDQEIEPGSPRLTSWKRASY
jgi:hypothetical protein